MTPFKSLLLSLSLFSFFFFLIHQSSSATTSSSSSSDGDIVPETCKLCADGDPNINYTICVESLGSVPESHRSDRPGLAVIAATLAKTEAEQAKSKAQQLLTAKRQSPYVDSCLQTCAEMYSTSMSDLHNAMGVIKAGQYEDANVYLSAALGTPATCEDGFTEGNADSPLTKENEDLADSVDIALAITGLLK